MGEGTKYFGQPMFAQAINFIKKSDVNGIVSKFQSDYYTKIQAVETEVRNMLMYYIDMYKLIYNPEKEWNNVNRKLFDSQLKIIFPK